MVVFQVRLKDPFQMSLVEHYDLSKALSSYGTDDPLCVRILPGRSRRRDYFFDAHVLDALAKKGTVGRVPITNRGAISSGNASMNC